MSPNATLRHAKEADDRDLDTSGLARWPTAIDQQSAGACSSRFVGLLTVPTVGSRAVLRAIATSVPGRLQPVIHPACRHSPQRLLSASASVPVRPKPEIRTRSPVFSEAELPVPIPTRSMRCSWGQSPRRWQSSNHSPSRPASRPRFTERAMGQPPGFSWASSARRKPRNRCRRSALRASGRGSS